MSLKNIGLGANEGKHVADVDGSCFYGTLSTHNVSPNNRHHTGNSSGRACLQFASFCDMPCAGRTTLLFLRGKIRKSERKVHKLRAHRDGRMDVQSYISMDCSPEEVVVVVVVSQQLPLARYDISKSGKWMDGSIVFRLSKNDWLTN